MDFIEEITPGNIRLKILFDKWQFLAFNKKGKSVYADNEGRSLLHNIPKIVFVGKYLKIKRDYHKEYNLLKVRNNSIIVPYFDTREKIKKYLFIKTDKKLDMIPVRISHVEDISILVKDVEVSYMPEYMVVDDSITRNDIVVIKNRYKVDEVIYADFENNYRRIENLSSVNEENIKINLNMMSSNPVFLARLHIRNMDLSKVNQLLLDFELSVLDTEYIYYFINELIKKSKEDKSIERHKPMLNELSYSYGFYINLLKKNDEDVRNMIAECNEIKKLAPLRTLILKAKSIYPGKTEQEIFTEYDYMVRKQKEFLETGGKPDIKKKAVTEPVINGITETDEIKEDEVFDVDEIKEEETFETEKMESEEIYDADEIKEDEVFDVGVIEEEGSLETEEIKGEEIYDADEIKEDEVFDIGVMEEEGSLETEEIKGEEIYDAEEINEEEIYDADKIKEE